MDAADLDLCTYPSTICWMTSSQSAGITRNNACVERVHTRRQKTKFHTHSVDWSSNRLDHQLQSRYAAKTAKQLRAPITPQKSMTYMEISQSDQKNTDDLREKGMIFRNSIMRSEEWKENTFIPMEPESNIRNGLEGSSLDPRDG